MRQLHSQIGNAWLYDLGDLRGPWLLVLRDREDEARERLAEHLVETRLVPDLAAAVDLLVEVDAETAGVLW